MKTNISQYQAVFGDKPNGSEGTFLFVFGKYAMKEKGKFEVCRRKVRRIAKRLGYSQIVLVA